MKNRILFYPTPFPEEHILGTLARWHAMLNGRTFLKSVADISSNTAVINPSSIWRLIYRDILRIYQNQFPVEEFLRHTLWHYYLPFHSRDAFSLSDESNSDTLRLLPTEQIRIKTARNWRWCHDCAQEDIAKVGTTYWHTVHQVPSLIHCRKHGKKLIYACSHCGFHSNDFNTLLLPPTDNKCPACKSNFDTSAIKDPIVEWIDGLTSTLICSPKRNAITSMKTVLVEKSKLPYLHDRNPYGDTRQVTRVQRAFNEFLHSINIMDHYFKFPSKNYGPRHPYLQVSLMLYSDTFFPPLYYLLLLKFLIKDDREIEDIIVEREKFHA
jgi:hypothetical protein